MGRQQSRGRSADPAVASAGGRGNEAGSVYRAGVAAYLATHGIAGRGLEAAGYPESGPAPVRLSFETGEAVDDIRCELADGTVLRLQAKRVCGDDKHLIATVAQWARQVHALQPGDMVGLATAEPRGDVKDLGLALERRRRAVPGPHTPGEKKALALVRKRLPSETSDEVAELVLRAALVMTATVSTSREEGFRSAANLLDGRFVASGSGSSAVNALQSEFWKQAKAGTGSDLDDWLQILADAKLQVFPDGEGSAGARRRAELDAVAAYRARLASRDGVLEFSLLAADALPPMTYEPLAASLRASVPGRGGSDTPFLFLARRWPRMLLTGLPGMGKTTALVQAAARWAVDPSAPLPLIVPLREIAGRNPRSGAEITLTVLIEAAMAGEPEWERASLRRALQQAVMTGGAALLLDGLDECRDRRAVVADGLAAVIRGLPRDTGVILATRDSGIPAAGKLNMPEARLTEPFDLASMLARLLRHAAHRFPAAERDHWIRQREQQLDEVRNGQADLLGIPLFAVLLTLLLAQPGRRAMPRGRAHLLAAAVRGTVEQWEVKRLSEHPVRPNVSADQILDGFAAISHAYISRPGGCSIRLLDQQVEAMLREQWSLSPGEAREHAREITWFWDEHVGVFTASAEGNEVEARSRVFAEIGEAMWAASCKPGELHAWITSALDDDNCREQVVLACGLSSDVADEVIGAARRAASPAVRTRSLLWPADAATHGAQPPADALTALMNELANAARHVDAEKGSHDEPSALKRGPRSGWQYILRLAMLPLPAALRAQREQLISGLVIGDYEEMLATALAALADAVADSSQILQVGQVKPVRALLVRPLPERARPTAGRSTRPGRYQARRRDILPGHQEVAQQAVRYADQLGREAADGIYRIAYHGGFRDYERVSNRLRSLGFESPKENSPSTGLAKVFANVPRIGSVRDIWPRFLKVASSLAPQRPLSDSERWRYTEVAALANALLAEEGTVVGVFNAVESEQPTLRHCMVAASHALGFDMPGISAEATLALEAWASGNQDVVDMIFAPPFTQPAINALRLDCQDKDALIEALGAGSDWLANIACTFLLEAHDHQIGAHASRRIQELAANRRANAVMVAIANDPDPADAASRYLNASDPPIRVGAAVATRMLAQTQASDSWTGLLNRALVDDDRTVRLAAGADPASNGRESYWSCDECGHANKIETSECNNCGEKSIFRVVTSS